MIPTAGRAPARGGLARCLSPSGSTAYRAIHELASHGLPLVRALPKRSHVAVAPSNRPTTSHYLENIAQRAKTIPEEPEGLLYRPDFISVREERGLLELVEGLEFQEVPMRGQAARRTVAHFGYDYDYEAWTLAPAPPLPPELGWLRNRCAQLAGLESGELAQALVSRYPAGAGIGWHRDAPMFGPKVVGVSLLSACRMRFQRRAGEVRRVHELELVPRSAYVLAGRARWAWQHSIPATKGLRYSITFRSVKRGSRWMRPSASREAES